MLTAVKSAVLAVFNRSRLWRPARVQSEGREPFPSPPPSVGFCEFPLELLTTILEELDWRDILQVRKVCKTLQGASKTRSIWLNLCRRHLFPTATAPRTLHLERPIKLYESRELEFLFLRLKSAEIGWKTDDRPPSRKRNFVTSNIPKCMYLLEGGRWLLIASHTGSVTYFDLDAQIPSERILIPGQVNPESETDIKMAIDRDNTSPFLLFNLAICFCAPETPTLDPKEHQVQIWKVSLALNEQQQGSGLSAELVASFPQQLRINGIYSLSLLGPHLALSVACPGYHDPKHAFIIDWEQANGDSTEYPMRMLLPEYGRGPPIIHLLPGCKVLAAGHGGLMIFDYDDIKEISSMPPLDHFEITAIPVWEEHTLSVRENAVSRPFFCSSSIRFSVRGRSYLFGVILDYPYEEDPSVGLAQAVKLIEFSSIPWSEGHPVYGYNKAVIVQDHADTHLICYSWPDEGNHQLSPAWFRREPTLDKCVFGPLMDEESGRVIVSTDDDNSSCHTIWDFSPLYSWDLFC